MPRHRLCRCVPAMALKAMSKIILVLPSHTDMEALLQNVEDYGIVDTATLFESVNGLSHWKVNGPEWFILTVTTVTGDVAMAQRIKTAVGDVGQFRSGRSLFGAPSATGVGWEWTSASWFCLCSTRSIISCSRICTPPSASPGLATGGAASVRCSRAANAAIAVE